MIKIKKIVSIAAIVLAMAAGMADSASAVGTITYSAATTVDLTTADMIISLGSTAEGVVFNADSIVVTVAADDVFTVTNATRRIQVTGSNTGVTVTSSCAAGVATAVVDATADGSGAYTITSASTACPTGTGGGGYSPPASTPTPTPSSTPVPTATPTPTLTPGPANPAAPSGVTLYRAEGDARVYVIKDGKKDWVKTAEEFTAAGYKWSDIIVTTPSIVAAYPDKTVVSGVTLYRAEGDTKVYVVKDNIKQWVKTAEEFTAAGYKWSDIIVTTPSVVAAYSDGTVSAVKVKVVNTASLRVRKSNTTASAILGAVKGSEIFTVLEEKSGWYKITTSGGITGWISGAYAVKQ